jgi:hypothetical protein
VVEKQVLKFPQTSLEPQSQQVVARLARTAEAQTLAWKSP